MAFKIITDLNQADELWREGLLYVQFTSSTEWHDDRWKLDCSQDCPDSAPSKYFPEDYVYAIQVED